MPTVRDTGCPQTVTLWAPCELWTWNGERRMNHFTRAALVREARGSALIAARQWMNSGGGRHFEVPVTVSFRPVQLRGVLADTAGHGPACKAVLDGFVDARLIPADSPEWVLAQTYTPPVKGPTPGVWATLVCEGDHPLHSTATPSGRVTRRNTAPR